MSDIENNPSATMHFIDQLRRLPGPVKYAVIPLVAFSASVVIGFPVIGAAVGFGEIVLLKIIDSRRDSGYSDGIKEKV